MPKPLAPTGDSLFLSLKDNVEGAMHKLTVEEATISLRLKTVRSDIRELKKIHRMLERSKWNPSNNGEA
jgi:hypothetical protein